MRRIVVIAAVVGLFAVPSSAQACSCIEPDPEQILARSDAAFIGVLTSVRILDESQPLNSGAIFRYRVKRAYGTEPGRYVRIVSSNSESLCGLPQQKNRTYAMAIDRRRGHWESGLCQLLAPGDLREAAAGTERTAAGGGGCASSATA